MIKEYLVTSERGDYMSHDGDVLPFDGSWEDLQDLTDNDTRQDIVLEAEADASMPVKVAEIFEDIDAERLQLRLYGAHENQIKAKMRKYYPRLIRACRESGVDAGQFISILGGYDVVTPVDDIEPADIIEFRLPTGGVATVDDTEREPDWFERQFKDN